MTNPTLVSSGPLSMSIPVTLFMYDGTTVETRGVVRNAQRTPGETEATWAAAGPLAWFNFDGEPEQLEFVQYTDPRTRRLTRRRVVYAEAQSGSLGWHTTYAVLQDVDLDATPTPQTGPATGQPGISGSPEVGRTLAATLGSIADPDGLVNQAFPSDFTFQWTRNHVAISGATARTYVVDMADVGEGIRVEVSFSDDNGNAEGPLASAPVTGVAAGVLPDADAPTVTIGPVTNVPENTTRSLIATVAGGTYDHLSYAWEVVSGGGTITGVGSHVTYNPPDVTADTAIQVRVTVTALGAGTNAQSGTSDHASDAEDFTVTPVFPPQYFWGISTDRTIDATDFPGALETAVPTGPFPNPYSGYRYQWFAVESDRGYPSDITREGASRSQLSAFAQQSGTVPYNGKTFVVGVTRRQRPSTDDAYTLVF